MFPYPTQSLAKTCADITVDETTRPLKVLYFYPQGAQGSFWHLQKSFTEHVAEGLGIDIETIPIQQQYHNRFSFLELINEKLTTATPPDYIVGIFYSNGEESLLELIEAHNIPYFSINTSLEKRGYATIGMPREQYSAWIGHMTPDDEQAGQELATLLAAQRSVSSIVAISGAHQSTVSRTRLTGYNRAMQRMRKESQRERTPKGIEWLPTMNSDWSANSAAKLTQALLDRVGRVDAYWTAGMDIAEGVLAIARQQDPPYQPVIGTFDWSHAALNAVRDGQVLVSFGGHFMEGGWTMALLLDHANGIDFKQELGVQISTRLQPVTKNNVQTISALLNKETWQSVNFRRYSKCYTPDLDEYDFRLVLQN